MTARRSFLAGLLGQGIGPSLTPELHEREAARQGLRYVYTSVDLGDDRIGRDHLVGLLAAAVELGFDGLNVTHPVKQTMVPLVDRVTPEVEAIGALNTVLVGADGGTVGHNTDVTGFGRAFADDLADVTRDEVVLLGAGGAGTAVAHALVAQGVRRLVVVDPDAARAAGLVESVRRAAPEVVVTAAPTDLAPALARADGLVNATPVGMAAHPGTPVPVDLLRPDLWVADIVYRPLHTELLRAAADRGCRTLTGAGMAVHQAADAFELITGRPADRAAMFRDFDQLVEAEAQHAQEPSPSSREHPGERNH